VGLGAAVVVAAAAVVVPLTVMEPSVAGSPLAADVPPTTAPSPAEPPVEPACAGDLAGSGSALARNAVTDVAAALERACPDTVVDYEPVGSGAGLQQFTSGATGMAVVDRPPSESELAPLRARCAPAVYPFAAHPVMIRYHVAGVGNLNLDAPTLAKIFSGAVTRWNDPAIVRQNPDTALSARPIVVVGRGDESPTTAAFQQYLAAAGGWAGGTDTTFTGTATQTAQGDSGMLAMIENTEGAIGYLTAAEGTRSQVLRLGGVAPDPEAVATTITSALPGRGLAIVPADVYGADPVAGAYPLVIVSYALVCAADAAARDFLLASLTVRDGGTGYVFPAGEWADRLRAALQ
jgi:phosphate transport system substrate-binding protein